MRATWSRKIGQVIAKPLQFAFCSQFKMPGNNLVYRERKHVIERNDPVFHIAFIHCRT